MRRDIQFLRGIAVLAVVLYHAGLFEFRNGFLGVDVFFVISGFLITTLILRGLESGDFSYANFYLRRARRLLPALYSTLAFTTVAAYALLTPRQWADYFDQLAGALTFTANMVLPFQVGYFDDAAETRPLLHIWSLSLEEQYYFLMPALLTLCAARWRGLLMLLLTLGSLALCLMLLQTTESYFDLPGADLAFYLFPARAWELLAGSLLAWCMLQRPGLGVPPWLKWSATAALLALLAYPLDAEHPRGDAVLAVLLTSVLLAGRDNWLPDVLPLRWVERVGDWSYSLYLLHWPLLAFAHIAYLGEIPGAVRWSLVVAALLLSALQYRFVETPLRRSGKPARRTLAGLTAATAGLLLLAVPGAATEWGWRDNPGPDFAELRRKNFGLHPVCVLQPPYRIPGRCKTAPAPRVAVWGDSYAMHLVPGLRANPATGDSLIQLTRSGCSPALRMAPIITGLARARQCRDFNARALAYITSSESLEYVVLSSPFGYFFGNWRRLLIGEELVPYERERVIRDVVAAIRRIQAAGKQVLIISPTPYAGFDVGECLERRAGDALVLGRTDCNISRAEQDRRQRVVIAGLNAVARRSGAELLWLTDLMCEGDVCRTSRNGIPLYRDRGHLSIRGSRLVLRDARLWDEIPGN